MSQEQAEQSSQTALEKLACSQKRPTFTGLWQALTSEERVRAAEQFLSDGLGQLPGVSAEDAEDIKKAYCEEMQAAVAKHKNYRQTSVNSWDNSKLAQTFAEIKSTQKSDLYEYLLTLLHFPDRQDLLAKFLSSLDIRHQNGVFEDPPETLAKLKKTEKQITRAVYQTCEEFDDRQVLTYAMFLVIDKTVGFSSLLATQLQKRCQVNDPIGFYEPESAVTPQVPQLNDQQDQLDRLLIQTLVATAETIDGAYTEDDCEELVDGVLRLNATHHRRYYHRGFFDVLFTRPLAIRGLVMNSSRKRWYWAGVVIGLSRQNAWPAIAEHYDDPNSSIRELGDGRDGASQGSAVFVVQALEDKDRMSDILNFVRGDRVLTQWGPDLFDRLYAIAVRLVRQDRTSEAQQFLDRLARVVENVENASADMSTVRRRQAQCAQRVGDFKTARSLLRSLIDELPENVTKGKMSADLGLIAAALRSLVDVKLPATRHKYESFVASLSKGREHFEKTEDWQPEYRGHGDLCLGVLLLSEGQFKEAITRLDNALSCFIRDRDAYRQIIESTELYLGIAIWNSYFSGLDQTARLQQASKLVINALNAKAIFPLYLLADTLHAMVVAGFHRECGQVGNAILKTCSDETRDETLEVLRGCDRDAKTEVSNLGNYFSDRATLNNRSRLERASDLREAFDLYRTHNTDRDKAAEILDRLEGLAVDGVGDEEFCTLLKQQMYDQVWALDDVLGPYVHVLSALGKTDEAATLLIKAFHRVLTAGEVEVAEGILGDLKGLGRDASTIDNLTKRLSSSQPPHGDPSKGITLQPVSVLLVGGDESFKKHESDIVADLQKRDPTITAGFIWSGWTSNWDTHLNDFRRRVPEYHAVVVTRLLRTEFGRSVRKSIPKGIPSSGCWKPSRGLAVQAIIRSANDARTNV